MRTVLWRWSPSILVMAAIFSFSHQTGDELGSLLPWFQRLFPHMQSFDWGHFVAYFGLCATYVWALGDERPTLKQKALAVVLCLLYGITDEFHQQFVEGRMPDVRDLANDTIGASLYAMLVSFRPFSIWYRKLPHSLKHSSKY